MSVPLIGVRGVLGVLNLARGPAEPAFNETDITDAEKLARPLAVILEEAEELQWARRGWRELQKLAAGGPERGVVMRASSCYQVAIAQLRSPLVAGDVTERVTGPGGAQTVMVADVAGHGTEALAAGSMLQGLFLAHVTHTQSPARLARLIHSDLYQRWNRGFHATAWIAHLSPNGQVASCNAGFPEPLCIPMDGSEPRWLAVGGPLLGISARPDYEEEEAQLLLGDCVLAISDGILGTHNESGLEFGIERVEELVLEGRRGPLEKLVGDVCEAALSFGGVKQPADDFTAMGIRFSRDD